MGRALRAGATPDRILGLFEEQLGFVDSSFAPGGGIGVRPAESADMRAVDRDRRRLAALDARILPMVDGCYPERLAALPDAPPVLLVRGCVRALRTPAVAIVGARAATRTARRQARRLGRELAARGFSIVSGLARGIDAEAHRGALEVGGRTIGVLACGLDRIYPPEHRDLADEISIDGALICEVPLGTAPRRELFPLRNRIISGLSLGVIVVEARRRSGSLITVRHALNQGREVWVVPGAIEGPFAEGSNQLLREGARAIRNAADVVEDLAGMHLSEPCAPEVPDAGPTTDPKHLTRSGEALPNVRNESAPEGSADSIEQRILAVLGTEAATRDDLIERVELDPGRLAGALLELELAGRIVEERDGRFHVCWG